MYLHTDGVDVNYDKLTLVLLSPIFSPMFEPPSNLRCWMHDVLVRYHGYCVSYLL